MLAVAGLKLLRRKHAISEVLQLDVLHKALHPPDKKIGFLSGAGKGKAQQTIRRRAEALRELPEWETFKAAHGQRLGGMLAALGQELKAARAARPPPRSRAPAAAGNPASDEDEPLAHEQSHEHEHEEDLMTILMARGPMGRPWQRWAARRS